MARQFTLKMPQSQGNQNQPKKKNKPRKPRHPDNNPHGIWAVVRALEECVIMMNTAGVTSDEGGLIDKKMIDIKAALREHDEHRAKQLAKWDAEESERVVKANLESDKLIKKSSDKIEIEQLRKDLRDMTSGFKAVVAIIPAGERDDVFDKIKQNQEHARKAVESKKEEDKVAMPDKTFTSGSNVFDPVGASSDLDN
jgi:hypothetical protein